MAQQQPPAQRADLIEMLKDLGWFPFAFAILVSGPSVLSLLQAVFVDYRLVDALQWIVDGYNRILAVLSGIFDPLLRPFVAWLNETFGWRLELQPHWRPLFVLAMVILTSAARGMMREKRYGAAAYYILVGGLFALAGAVGSGLVPIAGGWWSQGLAAAIPIVAVMLVLVILSGVNARALEPEMLGYTAMLGAGAFVLGAVLSFLPAVAVGAGVVAAALTIIAMGLWLLAESAGRDGLAARIGLTMIGGFVAALLIVAADAALRAFIHP